ncbi:MAG: four helix bundle protein [Myxococcales bacterium]|nr:four helix bundle protein [Myxococcales bacterium]
MFDAQTVAESFVTHLRPLVERIVLRDRDLASQLRRAATSAALNTAEGNRREGRDRHARFRIAAAECDEAACAVRIAVAWAYVDGAAAAPALALADRLAALLYRLRHPRP